MSGSGSPEASRLVIRLLQLGCKGEIAHLVGRVECAPHQRSARADVLRPRIDEVAEGHVNTGPEAVQAAPLNQLETDLTKAERRRVVIEVRAHDHAEPDVGKTRGSTVAMLEADVRHAAQNQAQQIVVCEQSRRDDLSQYI